MTTADEGNLTTGIPIALAEERFRGTTERAAAAGQSHML